MVAGNGAEYISMKFKIKFHVQYMQFLIFYVLFFKKVLFFSVADALTATDLSLIQQGVRSVVVGANVSTMVRNVVLSQLNT